MARAVPHCPTAPAVSPPKRRQGMRGLFPQHLVRGSAHSRRPQMSSVQGFSRFIQMGFSSQEEAWRHTEVSSH